jgi:hypothetical protein
MTPKEKFNTRIMNGKCPICGRQVTVQDFTKVDKNVTSKEVILKGDILIRVCEKHPMRDYKGRDVLESYR